MTHEEKNTMEAQNVTEQLRLQALDFDLFLKDKQHKEHTQSMDTATAIDTEAHTELAQ